METLLEDRVGFFQKSGPDIARRMTEALQKLTAEKIEVEFGGVQTLDEGKVLIDTGEKCFGSYVNFKCPEAELDGLVVIFFPLSGARALTELLLKRYLGQSDREDTYPEIRLSAFKEALSILLATYTAAIANALGVKLQTGVPKFARFRNFEFLKPGLLQGCSRPDRAACIGRFGITGGREDSIIKGLFISAF